MPELRSETLDVRTATSNVPGASLAYGLREAEGESNRTVLPMIGSPMGVSGPHPRTASPGPDRS